MSWARAGLRYGAGAFAAGGVLGPVRELLLVPRIGGMAAAWVEAAALAALLWLAARWAIAATAPWRARAMVGGVALGLVLLLEAALGLLLDASGLAAARAPRALAEQGVGLLLLAWLVALPFLVRRRAVALS